MERNQIKQIEILYKQYYKLLVAYAYRYLSDWNAANDAVQETFCDICRNPERILSSAQPLGWLKLACRYICLGILRKQKTDRQTLLSLETLDEGSLPPVYDTVFQNEVQMIIGMDDPSDMELLYKRFVLREPYEDIAKSLGITVGACYKRAERLRKKIKKNLKF